MSELQWRSHCNQIIRLGENNLPTEITPITYNIENPKKGITNTLAKVQSNLSKVGLNYALMAAPPYRRISAIPDKMSNDEVIYSLGMASLGAVNIIGDSKDIKEAARQVALSIQGKEYTGVYDFKHYQHDFSLCHGTLLERFINTKKMKNQRLAKTIESMDRTLLNTKVGQKILSLMGVKEATPVPFKQFNKASNAWEIVKDVNGKIKYARGFSGGKFGVLTAHVFARTIIPELMVFSLVEIPLIFRASKKGNNKREKAENTLKQTAKSAITVACLFAAFGYLGAIGSKYFKVFGSLAGMGVGAILGSKVAQRINKHID